MVCDFFRIWFLFVWTHIHCQLFAFLYEHIYAFALCKFCASKHYVNNIKFVINMHWVMSKSLDCCPQKNVQLQFTLEFSGLALWDIFFYLNWKFPSKNKKMFKISLNKYWIHIYHIWQHIRLTPISVGQIKKKTKY